MSTKTIKFIKSPMGLGLGYSEGETGEFNTAQADELIELGIAEETESEQETEKVEKAVKKSAEKVEKAVK